MRINQIRLVLSDNTAIVKRMQRRKNFAFHMKCVYFDRKINHKSITNQSINCFPAYQLWFMGPHTLS